MLIEEEENLDPEAGMIQGEKSDLAQEQIPIGIRLFAYSLSVGADQNA